MLKVYVAALLFFCTASAYCAPDWKLRKEENGIKIFTAGTDTSSFKLIKVEFTVAATTHQLVSFLMDVPSQPEWIYNCKTARILQQPAPNELIFYSEFTLPWPCSNRDYVTHFTVTQTAPGHTVINSYAAPDYIPSVSGKVRVKKSSAHWDIMQESEKEVKIIYEVHFDPGGSLPPWLVNMFVTKGPAQSFTKLRENINRPQYRDAHLPFLN